MSREILKQLQAGALTHEQAVQQFSGSPKRVKAEIVPAAHTELAHYDRRTHIEETAKDWTASVVYGAFGVVDGLFDGFAYGTSELVEDVVFFVSRTYSRALEGWERGKRR